MIDFAFLLANERTVDIKLPPSSGLSSKVKLVRHVMTQETPLSTHLKDPDTVQSTCAQVHLVLHVPRNLNIRSVIENTDHGSTFQNRTWRKLTVSWVYWKVGGSRLL